jgi:hypothetical protein
MFVVVDFSLHFVSIEMTVNVLVTLVLSILTRCLMLIDPRSGYLIAI